MISGKPTQPCLHDGSSRKEVISIADKKFRGRDKIVQKMTKDGLVDENLRTGEQKSATAEEKPEQEDSAKETAKKETDEKPIVEEERCMDAEDGEEDAPRHHSTAKQSADYCLTNGTYERARESGTEQNYDMIDGCVNNVPKKPRRIGGRWSVLDRLHIKQAERKQKEQPQQQQQERSRKN